MEPTRDQIRAILYYEKKLGTLASEPYRRINQVYPESIGKNTCYRWYKMFDEGRDTLKDESRPGRPQTVNDQELKALVEGDSFQTIRKLEDKTGTDKETIRRHLHSIGKIKKYGKFVPHELSEDGKLSRLTISSSLLSRQAQESFLQRMVTGDEKWILYDNPKKQKQWLDPCESGVPTANPDPHQKKDLLSVWWDIHGIIFFELVPPNRTITSEVFCKQLDKLHSGLKAKRLSLINRKGVIIQFDNATPHFSKITQKKLKELDYEVHPHPSHSPDLSPSDYDLFRSMQHFLSGKSYLNEEEVKEELKKYFASKNLEFYKKGIYELVNRWENVVECNGDYIT